MTQKKNGREWNDAIHSLVSELHGKRGYCCSETVLTAGLRRLNRENPDAVAMMGGFCGGACGDMCGSLAGATALLGLYLGRREDGAPSEALKQCSKELTEVFRAYWKSCNCSEIRPLIKEHGESCAIVMESAIEIAWRILNEHHITD